MTQLLSSLNRLIMGSAWCRRVTVTRGSEWRLLVYARSNMNMTGRRGSLTAMGTSGKRLWALEHLRCPRMS